MNRQHASNEARDDAALAAACRTGDVDAFEILVRRHQRLVFAIAFRLTGVYEDAGDVAQDTFLSAWRTMGTFRGDARFTTWLTAITVNTARNRLRQRRSRSVHEAYSLDAPLPDSDGDLAPEPSSGAPTALDQLETAEVRSALGRCIDALPTEFREVLVLREMQECSYDEVSAILGLREGTVKSRLFRARDLVRECLQRWAGRGER